jgi:hypothetical protein
MGKQIITIDATIGASLFLEKAARACHIISCAVSNLKYRYSNIPPIAASGTFSAAYRNRNHYSLACK